MLQWLKNLPLFRKPLTQEEIEDMEDSDPELFSEPQREYLKSLFPKGWTHLDNFDQEELMKIAVALTAFGYPIDGEPMFIRALAMLVKQEIVATANYNHLLRRA